MTLSTTQIRTRLRQPIGRPVAFRYPSGKGDRRGRLKDRAIVRSAPGPSGATYWDIVDLIEFPGERRPLYIRIGYYRQVGDELRWGSQTTIVEPVDMMTRLLTQAAIQKDWFARVVWRAASDVKKRLCGR